MMLFLSLQPLVQGWNQQIPQFVICFKECQCTFLSLLWDLGSSSLGYLSSSLMTSRRSREFLFVFYSAFLVSSSEVWSAESYSLSAQHSKNLINTIIYLFRSSMLELFLSFLELVYLHIFILVSPKVSYVILDLNVLWFPYNIFLKQNIFWI